MTRGELLRAYPRGTLRGRLGPSQGDFAGRLGVQPLTLVGRETGHAPIGRPNHRRQLAALLASHLASADVEALVRSPGRGEDGAV